MIKRYEYRTTVRALRYDADALAERDLLRTLLVDFNLIFHHTRRLMIPTINGTVQVPDGHWVVLSNGQIQVYTDDQFHVRFVEAPDAC